MIVVLSLWAVLSLVVLHFLVGGIWYLVFCIKAERSLREVKMRYNCSTWEKEDLVNNASFISYWWKWETYLVSKHLNFLREIKSAADDLSAELLIVKLDEALEEKEKAADRMKLAKVAEKKLQQLKE